MRLYHVTVQLRDGSHLHIMKLKRDTCPKKNHDCYEVKHSILQNGNACLFSRDYSLNHSCTDHVATTWLIYFTSSGE
jgi:hypothetical protein